MSDCPGILAARDARKAEEARKLSAFMASLNCIPAWNNQCGNNFPRPANDTSEEAMCDSFIKSCGVDAGGTYNPITGECDNVVPWSVDSAGNRISVEQAAISAIPTAEVLPVVTLTTTAPPITPPPPLGTNTIAVLLVFVIGVIALYLIRR